MARSSSVDLPLANGDQTTMNIPIGLAFEARPSEVGRIWIMLRLNMSRFKDDNGTVTTNRLGFSLGAIGLHYVLPN